MKYSLGQSVVAELLVLTLTASACAAADVAYQADRLAKATGDYQSARVRYEQAMSNLVSQRQLALKAIKSSPEYQQAVRQVEVAHSKYENARQAATTDLQKTSERYRDLKRQLDAVVADIERARNNSATSIETFTRLYERKADISAQIKAMDNAAAQSGDVGQLKSQWSEASKAVETLDAQMRSQIEKSPAVADARDKAEAAQKELNAIGVELTRAQAGYQISMQQAQAEYYRAQQAQYLENQNPDWVAAVVPGLRPWGPIIRPPVPRLR